MANILYLVHRMPYPPNKGDKVRSFHLLKHLLQQHRVFLGTFIDDPDDEPYLETLRTLCPNNHIARLSPRLGRLRSLRGLVTGEALSLPFYRDAGLQAWVDDVCRTEAIDAVVVFSSVMAQYVEAHPQLPMLVDFVDVDSAKWTQYAPNHRWPMSLVYRREGRRLLAFERHVAQRAAQSFFVTENEAALFHAAAPETRAKVGAICNGVDSDFFTPGDFANPYAPNAPALVFTGAMDYWPNIDAVCWFVAEVLPALQARWPALCFYIVGRNPAPAVQALAGERVVVTGTVDDVRPYLQYANCVVAPLRVARGIQNKILEAMAMARPVVSSASCATAIDAKVGTDFLAAETVDDYVTHISNLLSDPAAADQMGHAGRAAVVARYSWEAHLGGLDRHLAAVVPSMNRAEA